MDDLDLGSTIKGFAPGQKVLNRYKLERILGRGGMGVVWLARDGELDREVALKFLPEIVALDPEAVADLKRETRRNLELTHPHIVRIYDFVSDGRTAAISMEYVNGATLSALKLDQPGRIFPVATLAPWVRQLCEALAYAHTEAQVVHRDLKPANLMIDARGRLKITDFGIARGISDSVSRVSAQAGGSSGTPLYMSPQQMMGEKAAATDDIYAVGATLYELLTGKPPFHSGNVLLQVQNKIPPPIMDRRRELEATGEPVPPEWESTIAACLNKEPAARPPSAEELWRRLSGAAKPVAVSATPAPVAGAAVAPPATAPKKSRGPLIAGVAAGLITLGGLGWYFGVYAPEQQRLADIKRLEEEGRAADALKLKNERERTEAALKEKAEQDRAIAARLAAARGGVIVRSNPAGAEVTVGALEHGAAPLTLKDVKLGKYPVKARLSGYEDWSGEVEVKENEFAEVNIELARWSGRLALSAEGAGVEADVRARDGGAPARRVRLPATLTLPVGRYELVFHRAGWMDQTKTAEITRNQQTAAMADYRGVKRTPEWYGTAKLAELQAAADAGDLEARVRVGDHYYLGLDGPVDVKRAYDQYQQAVAAKYPAAYRRLSLILAGYVIGPDPYARSIELWRAGAEAGDPVGVLGWQARAKTPNGLKDTSPAITDEAAKDALRQAVTQAEQGDLFVMEQLAGVYGNRTSPMFNEAESRRWRKEGAERGSVRCMSLHASQLLTDKTLSEALVWMNKSAAAGCDLALNRLGQLYRSGGDQVPVDKAKGLALLRQAGAHDYYFAMGALGQAYEIGDGVTADPAESLRWRQKAAESGSPFYLNTLASAYSRGVGTPANPARAVELYRRSAEWNDTTALHQLGLLYAAGNGVAQSEAQAVEYFRRAARLNYSPSQEELKKRNLTW